MDERKETPEPVPVSLPVNQLLPSLPGDRRVRSPSAGTTTGNSTLTGRDTRVVQGPGGPGTQETTRRGRAPLIPSVDPRRVSNQEWEDKDPRGRTVWERPRNDTGVSTYLRRGSFSVSGPRSLRGRRLVP